MGGGVLVSLPCCWQDISARRICVRPDTCVHNSTEALHVNARNICRNVYIAYEHSTNRQTFACLACVDIYDICNTQKHTHTHTHMCVCVCVCVHIHIHIHVHIRHVCNTHKLIHTYILGNRFTLVRPSRALGTPVTASSKRTVPPETPSMRYGQVTSSTLLNLFSKHGSPEDLARFVPVLLCGRAWARTSQ